MVTPAGMVLIWRKTLRAEAKGIRRRHARVVQTEQPRKGSTWHRRHPQLHPLIVLTINSET